MKNLEFDIDGLEVINKKLSNRVLNGGLLFFKKKDPYVISELPLL